MSEKIPVSTVLLTKNSAKNLPAYFASMRDVDDIIVLDGGSVDGTQELVKQESNCRLFPQDPQYLDAKGYITNFSALRNQGYALARHPWIICIDSDEEATPELLAEVRRIIAENKHGVYYVQRAFYYGGERVKMPSWIESDHIRFFSLEWVRGCMKATHERLDIIEGAPIGHIAAAVKLPLAPPEALRPKYDRSLAIEVNAYKDVSFFRWFRWLFIRNILSILPRPFIYFSLYFKPGPGRPAPFIYDYEQMRYSWLLLWRTRPFRRRQPATAAQTAAS